MAIKRLIVCDECKAEEVAESNLDGYPGHWLGLQGGHGSLDAKETVGVEYGRLRSLSDTPKWFCSWTCVVQFAKRGASHEPMVKLADAASRVLHAQAVLSGEAPLHLTAESLDRVCPRSNPVEGDLVHVVGPYPQHAEGTFRGWRSDGVSFYAAIENGDVGHTLRVTGQGRARVYLARECPQQHREAQVA